MGFADFVVGAMRPWVFRGKYRVLEKILPKAGVREAVVNGVRMELDISDFIQRTIYMGCFEERIARQVREHLGKGQVMVDIGANVGFYTTLAASLVGPEGKVFAVEPSPYAHGRLSRMIERNGLKHVKSFQMGMSDKAGELVLYLPPEESHHHTPTMVDTGTGTPVKVRVGTLDESLKAWGVERVDFMKVDVEGHEKRVLLGGEGAIKGGRVGVILIEFNEVWLKGSGTSSREVWDMLHDWGYVPAKGEGFPDVEHVDAVSVFFVRK